jgi:hypothetical protein
MILIVFFLGKYTSLIKEDHCNQFADIAAGREED